MGVFGGVEVGVGGTWMPQLPWKQRVSKSVDKWSRQLDEM